MALDKKIRKLNKNFTKEETLPSIISFSINYGLPEFVKRKYNLSKLELYFNKTKFLILTSGIIIPKTIEFENYNKEPKELEFEINAPGTYKFLKTFEDGNLKNLKTDFKKRGNFEQRLFEQRLGLWLVPKPKIDTLNSHVKLISKTENKHLPIHLSPNNQLYFPEILFQFKFANLHNGEAILQFKGGKNYL